MTDSETACTYAALILVDDDVAITSEKITTLLKAANVDVEPIWPSLFARAVDGMNVKDLITNIGANAGGAGAPAAGGAAESAAAPEEKKEEAKKEESEDESDDDMGFGLFD